MFVAEFVHPSDEHSIPVEPILEPIYNNLIAIGYDVTESEIHRILGKYDSPGRVIVITFQI